MTTVPTKIATVEPGPVLVSGWLGAAVLLLVGAVVAVVVGAVLLEALELVEPDDGVVVALVLGVVLDLAGCLELEVVLALACPFSL